MTKFYDNIDEIIEQGYYLSHDFEISDEMPDYPVNPFMVSSDFSNNDNDNSSSGLR